MLVLGHRGAIIKDAPFYQNSMGAFREALETADGFETDACPDADKQIFLMHEAKYVDPAKGVEYCAEEYLDAASVALVAGRRIDQLSTVDMRKLRLKDGSEIPVLESTLRMVGEKRGKILNIELKGYGSAGLVIDICAKAFKQGVIRPDCVLISSFNHYALPEVREKLPDVKVGAITTFPHIPIAPLFPWQPGSPGAYHPLNEATLDQPVLKQVQPDVFVMPEKLLSMSSVDLITGRFPKAGLSGWIFTEMGDFVLEDLQQRLAAVHPTGKIASVLVDNPRKYAPLLR